MSKEDLIPIRTTEEAKKRGRNGGKKSGEARRKKRELRESLEILLQLPLKPGEVTELDNLSDVSKEALKQANLSSQDLITIAMIREATKGNVRAYETIRDQLGQKPIEKTEVKIEGDIDLQQADIDDLLKSVKKLKK